MLKPLTFPNPLAGSIPVKLFVLITKCITASIARMPPSGSVPVNRLFLMLNIVLVTFPNVDLVLVTLPNPLS
eukprot:2270490-Amphidinium_carterae.1